MNIPRIGLGTFRLQGQQVIDSVLTGLDVGYRHIDTAQIHPFLQNRKLAAFAEGKGIALTAYMPLAYGKVMHDPVMQRIAAKHGVSPAQVALAWLLAQGYAVIPSSTQRANLVSNLAAQFLSLDEDDMHAIGQLDRGERLVDPDFAPAWD
jgi:2,5-diketo-D-gluconate reductase B